MVIFDESESLLAHFDEQTMVRKEIGIWNLFDELLQHSGKVLFTGGDISSRSLSFASAYSDITYINNRNTEGNKAINLMLDEEQWQTHLDADLSKYYNEELRFIVCIVSQSSSNVVTLESDLKQRFHTSPSIGSSARTAARRSNRRSRTSTRHAIASMCSSTARR